MGHAAEKHVFTAAEYLLWEADQPERHEFVDGETFGMAGAEDRHVTLTMNLAFALRQHLSGSPCRTFMTDMRLSVQVLGSYFYPDIFVTCSERDAQSPREKSEPKLIVEVLSNSTAAYDRGLKFSYYRNLSSLQEYVLVDLDTRSTDCYRKGADGFWVLHPFAKGDAVQLDSVALEVSAAQLFAEVPEGPHSTVLSDTGRS